MQGIEFRVDAIIPLYERLLNKSLLNVLCHHLVVILDITPSLDYSY